MTAQDPVSPGELLLMELRPSRLLLVATLLAHFSALVAVVLAAIPVLLCLTGAAAIVLSGYSFYRRQQLICFLRMSSGDIAFRQDDEWIPVTLESTPWCNEWLQVLRLRSSPDVHGMSGRTGTMRGWSRRRPRRLSVVILPDSASAQSRRRLRVLLRWYSFVGGVPV